MKISQWLVVLFVGIASFAGGAVFVTDDPQAAAGGSNPTRGEDSTPDVSHYPSHVTLNGELQSAELLQSGMMLRGEYLSLDYGSENGVIIYVVTPEGERVKAVQQDESSMVDDTGAYFAPLDDPAGGTYVIEVTDYDMSDLERVTNQAYRVDMSPR